MALQTLAEYEAALDRIEPLMDATPGTPEEDELEMIAKQIQAYERIHWPMGNEVNDD